MSGPPGGPQASFKVGPLLCSGPTPLDTIPFFQMPATQPAASLLSGTTYSISQSSSNPKTGCGVGHQLPPFLAVPANKRIGSSNSSISLIASYKRREGKTKQKSSNILAEIRIIVIVSTSKCLPPKSQKFYILLIYKYADIQSYAKLFHPYIDIKIHPAFQNAYNASSKEANSFSF